MTLKEFLNELARRTDTPTQKIGADETNRVASEMFGLLSGLGCCEFAEVVTAGAKAYHAKKAREAKKAAKCK